MKTIVTALLMSILLAVGAGPLLAGKGGKGKPGGGGEPPADPAIAYIDHVRNGGNQLWVMDADGANQTLLLGSSGGGVGESAMNPSWTPDGTQILFESNVQGNGIYVVDPDGSNLTMLHALNVRAALPGHAHPALSPVSTPDGTYRIAFCDLDAGYDPSTAHADLFVMAPDGSDVQRLIETPSTGEFDLAWSPGGDRLVVYTYPPYQLLVYDLSVVDGLLTATLSADLIDVPGSPLGSGVQHFDNPAWANTQDKVAIEATTEAGSRDIWVVDVNSPANAVRLTNVVGGLAREPDWSPDDSRILYNDDGRIFWMAADGTDVVKIAGKKQGGSLSQPAWR